MMPYHQQLIWSGYTAQVEKEIDRDGAYLRLPRKIRISHVGAGLPANRLITKTLLSRLLLLPPGENWGEVTKYANRLIPYPLILGNCSLRRLKRLLLVPYLLHGPGQPLDRFPVSPSPCSRGLLPEGEGILTFYDNSQALRSNTRLFLCVHPAKPPGCGTHDVPDPSYIRWWNRLQSKCHSAKRRSFRFLCNCHVYPPTDAVTGGKFIDCVYPI
jgi:hypothetical protein